MAQCPLFTAARRTLAPSLLLAFLALAAAAAAPQPAPRQTKVIAVQSGKIQGAWNAAGTVRMFKGVPFAAPPVGNLRWRAPQPPPAWAGVRRADHFGPSCAQNKVYNDIFFRDAQPSEDCLNLDIWAPPAPAGAKLPVLVWYYGGGFQAGGASEPRYDGEHLAAKGIIVVNPNYRLGVFGFFADAALARESGRGAAGNYGMLDEAAALRWVVRNIAAFGGDPNHITIAGESAGSFSVSALMASPLTRNLFQGALGESGAYFPDGNDQALPLRSLAASEAVGAQFAAQLLHTTPRAAATAASLARLRALPAATLLAAQAKFRGGFAFAPIVDGYFLPATVAAIFARGQQARVPLLAGWNADEGKPFVLFNRPTPAGFAALAQKRFGPNAPEFLRLFPNNGEAETFASAEALASDDFTVYPTWRWIQAQGRGGVPVYEYHFLQAPPVKPGTMMGPIPASEMGSKHAGEIEYVFETLRSRDVPWSAGDFRLSRTMANYWVNFVKSGDPNGPGLPNWPAYQAATDYQAMNLSDGSVAAAPAAHRARFLFLEREAARPRPPLPPASNGR